MLTPGVLSVQAYSRPQVTVEQGAGQMDPANVTPVVFEIVFDRPILASSLGVDDIVQMGTAGDLTWSLEETVPGLRFDLLAVAVGVEGLIEPVLLSGAASDANGFESLASTSDDNSVLFDPDALFVSIAQQAGQADPTTELPILFDVVFNKPIVASSFTVDDVVQSGSAGAVVWSLQPVVEGLTYILQADFVGVAGTVSPGIIDGSVVDPASNAVFTSPGGDGTVSLWPTASFSADATSVDEGAGSAAVSVLTSLASNEPVRLDLGFGGTASAGTDYLLPPTGQIEVAVGATSGVVDLVLIDDQQPEETEEIVVSLESAAGAMITEPAVQTVSIIDDDEHTLSISDASAPEGDTVQLVVTLSALASDDVTFDWTTQDGTALAGSDYTASSGTGAMIPAGSLSTTLDVPTLEDMVDEPDESFSVVISNPANATIANDSASGTIQDNDDLPVVTFGYATLDVVEGEGSVDLELLLSHASSQSVTVDYTTGGTATIGADHDLPASGQVVFTAGSQTATIPLQAMADGVFEPDESVVVTLQSPVGAQLGVPSVLTVTILGAIVEPTYETSGPDWNHYVVHDNPGGAVYQQADLPCSPDPGPHGVFDECLHAGELRKVSVRDLAVCGGFSAADDLDAFDWTCDDSGGNAVFYSLGLKPGRQLADLLSAGGWTPNAVTISDGGSSLRTPQRAWWENPVLPLPENAGAGPTSLAVEGDIYVVEGDLVCDGYIIDADRIGIVVMPGSTVSFRGRDVDGLAGVDLNTPEFGVYGEYFAMIGIADQSFVWMEGAYDTSAGGLTSADDGVFAYGTAFSRFQHLFIRRVPWEGLYLYNSHANTILDVETEGAGSEGCGVGMEYSNGNLFRDYRSYRTDTAFCLYYAHRNRALDLRTYDSRYYGIIIYGSHANVMSRVLISNTTYYGLEIYRAAMSFGNIITDLVSFNNGVQGGSYDLGQGFNNDRSWNSTFSHFSTFNNSYNGFWVGRSNRARRNVYNSIVSGNNRDAGLIIQDANDDLNVFSNVVSWSNDRGIVAQADGTRFTGHLLVGMNARTDCQASDANHGLDDGTCANNSGSDAHLVTGVDLNSAFIDKLTVPDSQNADGGPIHQADQITDFLTFENRFRCWACANNSFPDTTNCGYCRGSADNHIWDWRLRAADNVIHQRVQHGDSDNDPFINGAVCPGAVHGDRTITDNVTIEIVGVDGNDDYVCDTGETCDPPNTFLVNALEILDDGIGDEDGLCESAEACIYTPNFGAYQGEGDYSSNTCQFENGVGPEAVVDVTMYAYPLSAVSPSLALEQPDSNVRVNLFNQASFDISGRCTEEGQAVDMTGDLTGSTTCTGGSFSFTRDLSGFLDGPINLALTHGTPVFTDQLGLIKDTTVPAVAFVSPAPGTLIDSWNVAVFEISGTCSDNGREVILSGDINHVTVCANSSWSARLDLTSLPQGIANVTVEHEDFALNGLATDTTWFDKNTWLPAVTGGPGCLEPPCEILFGVGDGDFNDGPDVSAVAEQTLQVALAELDENGQLDLIEVNQNNVKRYLGDGTGGFGAALDISDANATAAVALGDFNNDGHVDLVYATDARNRLYLGVGDGSFGAGSNISNDAVPSVSVAAGDLDNDGALDLVFGNSLAVDRVYLGDGAGGFLAGSDVSADTAGTNVFLSDIDGDGNLDLLTGKAAANEVVLQLGDGAGSFGAELPVASDGSVVLSGFFGNNQNTMDLVVIDTTGLVETRRLSGLGDGTFDPPVDITAGFPARAGVLAGLNSDRYADFFSVTAGAVVDHRYRGFSGGTFDTAVTISSDALDGISATAGDLDGDGAVDLVVGQATEMNRVYLGTR